MVNNLNSFIIKWSDGCDDLIRSLIPVTTDIASQWLESSIKENRSNIGRSEIEGTGLVKRVRYRVKGRNIVKVGVLASQFPPALLAP